jgi:hypothetical protein
MLKIDSLWRRVVDCKYGSQRRGWCSNQTETIRGQFMEIYKSWLGLFFEYLTFKVGDGTRIKFWKDSWCGDQPLQTRFPELFRLAHDPDAMVATHLHSS